MALSSITLLPSVTVQTAPPPTFGTSVMSTVIVLNVLGFLTVMRPPIVQPPSVYPSGVAVTV